jgi:hypothetical protein
MIDTLELFITELKNFDYSPKFQLDLICLRMETEKRLLHIRKQDKNKTLQNILYLNDVFAHIHSGSTATNFKTIDNDILNG